MANYDGVAEATKQIMVKRKLSGKIARRQIRKRLTNQRRYAPGTVGCQYNSTIPREYELMTTTRRQRREKAKKTRRLLKLEERFAQ